MNGLGCVLSLALSGCTATVNRFTVDRVVRGALITPDVGQVCALGTSLSHVLVAAAEEKYPPHLAMVVAETAAGICAQADAWEFELERLRAPPTAVAAITDARERERRAHALAASRFWRAWKHAEAEYGLLGEACPRLAADDEVVWLFAHLAGFLAVMHDKSSAGTQDVPLDVVAKVGRGARCIDSARWWHVPEALAAAAWVTIPGLAPKQVDAWAELERTAARGDAVGVRVARAIEALLAGNADRRDILDAAIRAHAQSLKTTPAAAGAELFDEYARLVTLHQSDVWWTTAKQHRTLKFGELPEDDASMRPRSAPASPGEDVF